MSPNLFRVKSVSGDMASGMSGVEYSSLRVNVQSPIICVGT